MKSTKKALFMSCLSLLLCVSMLIGTTFAWFTDTVQSGVNQIVAGNLDIEVSYKNGNEWTSIQGVDSLFSKGLWEPGHTEYVTLKVENKGTLALNYKVMVSPVSETGGVNVNGASFKLSDYIKFGTAEVETVADRAAARALVEENATGLGNQAALTKESTMAADAAAQYITLVVYMPENVGNDANYKTGTVTPKIELGITVVATQLTSENDSFGPDYDSGAIGATHAAYQVGPSYNYFPQVVKAVEVEKDFDEENNIVKVTTDVAIQVTESEAVGAQVLADVRVPANVVLENTAENLTLKVTPKAPTSETTAAAGLAVEIEDNNREIANFDIKIDGVSSSNTVDIPVSIFVGKGLSQVKVYHNGTAISGVTYNSTTGMVSFSTKTFSDFTVAYNTAAAAVGSQVYGSVADAVAAAPAGATVVLLRDSAVTAPVMVNKVLTIDLNGKTLTEDETNKLTNDRNHMRDDTQSGKILFVADPDAKPEEKWEENGTTGTLTVYTQTQLQSAVTTINEKLQQKQGMSVTLKIANDIAMVGDWTPLSLKEAIFNSLTIDGQNHKITGMTISEKKDSGIIGNVNGVNSKLKFENLTLEGVKITGTGTEGGAAGAFVGEGETFAEDAVYFKNCHIDGIEITNAKYIGGFFGHVNNTVLNGCSIKNAKLSGYKVGGLIGFSAGNVTIDGCNVADVAMTATKKTSAGGTPMASIYVGQASAESNVNITISSHSSVTSQNGGVTSAYFTSIEVAVPAN